MIVGVCVVACLCGGLLLFDLLTESDKEKIGKIVDQAKEAVEAADWEKCMGFVWTRYHEDGIDYERLNTIAKLLAGRTGTMDIWLHRRRITVEGRRAAMTAEAVAIPASDSPRLPGASRSTWQVSFRKIDGNWVISGVFPLKVAGRNVSTVADLQHMPF